MPYVIQRDDGKFVSKSGSEHSYTDKLQNARTWTLREHAVPEVCPGNERIVHTDEIFGVRFTGF